MEYTNMTRKIIPIVGGGSDDWEKYAKDLLAGTENPATAPDDSPLIVTANIDKRQYIKVPQKGIVIAISETLHNNQWKPTIENLATQGLFMPRPDYMTQHFVNVREAAAGRGKLFYADGTQLSPAEITGIWDYISSTDRKKFNGKVCWTWLDALFKKDTNNKLYMETDHRVAGGAMRSTNLNLSGHMATNSLANLSFNNEGLPNVASPHTSYKQGENMYFWPPVENRVARFVAGSVSAYLYCDWVPASSDPQLGVFACAAGIAPKNSGGTA